MLEKLLGCEKGKSELILAADAMIAAVLSAGMARTTDVYSFLGVCQHLFVIYGKHI